MHLWESDRMDFSETSAAGIHSSQRESKSVEKKIENRTATDKRRMKHNHFTKGSFVF